MVLLITLKLYLIIQLNPVKQYLAFLVSHEFSRYALAIWTPKSYFYDCLVLLLRLLWH
jgi:hypothetical protein